MKIEHINGKITDTDELNDINALIWEKGVELRQLCEDNSLPILILFKDCSTNNTDKDPTSMWSTGFKKNIPNKNEQFKLCHAQMIKMIDTFRDWYMARKELYDKIDFDDGGNIT